jgi:WD40-like Beta Propeller Repeat
MRTFLLGALALASFGGGEQPDGKLVLGVAGHDHRLGAVTREWAAVADPRTGVIRKRRLAGGALCHGPVLAVGDRVVFSGRLGRHAVARSLPLSLTGPAQVIGTAGVFAGSPGEPSLWRSRGQRTLALPAGARWLGSEGTFSPDGLELALPISLRGRARLAVANLRTRRWTLAPGELGGYQTAAWSPSGRWLYFTAGEQELGAWQVGSANAVPLSIEPGGTVTSIATAG